MLPRVPSLLCCVVLAAVASAGEPPCDSISLHRHSTMALEPNYTVTFSRAGAASLADHGSRAPGLFRGRISSARFAELCDLISAARFEALQSAYERPVTDEQEVVVTVRTHSGTRVVRDYAAAGPPELHRLEEALDVRRKSTQWQRVRETSNQAMQLTAPRSVSELCAATTFNLQPRALSGAVADLVSR